MYIKIGALKLLNIRVKQNGIVVYEGTTENAPEELKETNYKLATFDSGYVEIEI